MLKLLENLEKYILLGVVLLLPLVFSSLFPSIFEFPKLVLLALGVCLALIVKALHTLLKGELKIATSPLDFPLLLLVVSYLVSAFTQTPNKMEAFLLPGSATVVILLVLFFFLINSSEIKERVPGTLLISGALVSLFSVLSFFNVFSVVPQLPSFMKTPEFSLTESKLVEALFLATLVPLGIFSLLKERGAAKKALGSLYLILIVVSLVMAVYKLLPGKSNEVRLASFATSWSVSIDALKQSPQFGVWAGNYLTAFNRFKPLSYNATPLWNVRFITARNWPFTLLTEVGLLGVAAFILLTFKIYKMVSTLVKERQGLQIEKSDLPMASLAIISVLLFLFPPGLMLLFVFFVLLAVLTKTKLTNIQLSAFAYSESQSRSSKVPAFLLAAPVLVLGVALLIFGGRAVLAESSFKKSLDAIAKNDGKLTYDLMQKAINLNPFVDRYHSSYTQVNLALARNLTQAENLSEEDRNVASQLVQQAIREARTTVGLNTLRSQNWQLLAQTYQSIIPLTQGADKFAIDYYNQAIALDPYNPSLRIALGGIYYSQGNYDDAIKAFELAVVSKQDLGNAHYNLALALKGKGDTVRAIAEMKNTLALLPKDSKDYELAKEELAKLESAAPTKTGEGESGESLSTPTDTTPVVDPPLPLPSESPIPTPTPAP